MTDMNNQGIQGTLNSVSEKLNSLINSPGSGLNADTLLILLLIISLYKSRENAGLIIALGYIML
ncbi:MAG: hypothetical protein Q4D76_09200 [Oscillospiraceae bacterium]|nr:hypothetical protein [Oscillospiraceae bacterium]